MCLAQGPQHSDTGEARTRDPSVSSKALYHWPTAAFPENSVDTDQNPTRFFFQNKRLIHTNNGNKQLDRLVIWNSYNVKTQLQDISKEWVTKILFSYFSTKTYVKTDG